jgi:hypothetical protein
VQHVINAGMPNRFPAAQQNFADFR